MVFYSSGLHFSSFFQHQNFSADGLIFAVAYSGYAGHNLANASQMPSDSPTDNKYKRPCCMKISTDIIKEPPLKYFCGYRGALAFNF